MSAPRLVVCGLEPGPAVPLVAGALLQAFAGQRSVRPISVGLDMPLWRLLYDMAARAPRVLDPALHDHELAAELCDAWADGSDLLLVVAVEPALDSWQGVRGSRAVDLAARFDTPLVLVVDARESGATQAATVYGVKALAGRVEIAGVVLVGGDEHGPAGELARAVQRDAGLPVLGWVPPRLAEQFARQYGAGGSGPRPAAAAARRLCSEAAACLHLDELEAAATRRGYLPAVARRVLSLSPAATGLTLAVAWGAPLEPFALENVDLLQALGLQLAPLHIGRDRELPPDTSGLLLAGQLDEDELPAFSANRELRAVLAEAVTDGLPTLALGGGALLLLRRLADSRGRSHELAGVLPAEAELLEWYDRPRYVRAESTRLNPFDEGDNVLYELFDLEFLVLEQETFAYRVGGPGEAGQAEGFALGRCLATTLYPTLPLRPALAHRFVDAMRLHGPVS